jgi:hypothetical protein
MRLALLAPLAALAFVAASPGSNAASSQATLTVVCQRTPLYIFLPGQNLPQRSPDNQASLGQRFRLVSGPRSTLEGVRYYETDIPVNDTGFPPGTQYWIKSDCVQPSS